MTAALLLTALAFVPRIALAGGFSNANLQLQVLTTSCTSTGREDTFQITNAGTAPIALSDIGIKYWAYDTTGLALQAHVKKRGRLTGRDHDCRDHSCAVGEHGNGHGGGDDDGEHVGDVDASTTSFSPACGPDPSHQANWEIAVTETGGDVLEPGESWTGIEIALRLAQLAAFTPGTASWFSPCLTGAAYASDPHYALYVAGKEVFSSGIDSPSCRSPHGAQQLSGYFVPPISTAPVVGPVPASATIDLAIGLPFRDPQGVETLTQEVSDPTSPMYRQFMSRPAFIATFSPFAADYQAVVAWAQAHNLSVVSTYPDRLLLSVRGAAADVEQALYVNLDFALRPDGTVFYALDREPSLDLSVGLLRVDGLDDFFVATALGASRTNLLQERDLYASADLRNAYAPCTGLTGAQQSVGILSGAVVDHADIEDPSKGYEHLVGLSAPLPTIVEVAEPGPSLPTLQGSSNGYRQEATLDIEMAIAMAPGLSAVKSFVGTPDMLGNISATSCDAMVHGLANDPSILQGSSSIGCGNSNVWGTAIGMMSATGVSFFEASGDCGADCGSRPDGYHITTVGGTLLSMAGAGVMYQAEQAWHFSSGGVETGNILSWPWQFPAGSTPPNGASSQYRNDPDISMVAQNVFVVIGQNPTTMCGTSASSPLFAGFTALVNQQVAKNNNSTGVGPGVGFVSPSLWAIGLNGSPTVLASSFHDVVAGPGPVDANGCNFGNFVAHTPGAGYDLATGWGSPRCGLIDQLACATCPGTHAPPYDGCVHLQTDTSNCGACGVACAAGQVCVKGTCTSQPTAPLAVGTSATPIGPRQMVVDTTSVYWTDGQSAMQVSTAGGSPQTWQGTPTQAPVSTGPAAIAVDAQLLYWVEPVDPAITSDNDLGNVWVVNRDPQSASPGTPKLLLSACTGGGLCSMPRNRWVGGFRAQASTTGAALFWVSDTGDPTQTDTNALWQLKWLEPVPFNNTLSQVGTLPAPGFAEFGGTLAVDPYTIYWGSSDPVQRNPLVNGLASTPTTVMAPNESFSVIDVNGANVYFSVLGGPIKSVPVTASNATPSVLTFTDPNTYACTFVLDFKVDETDAYVLGLLSTAPPPCPAQPAIYRVPLDGSAPSLVVTPTGVPSSIAIDDAAVYWGDLNPPGAVYKFYK